MPTTTDDIDEHNIDNLAELVNDDSRHDNAHNNTPYHAAGPDNHDCLV